MDLVYLVPSWKMFPTSTPRLMRRWGRPHTGQMPPETALAMSTSSAPGRSRSMDSPPK